jgi:hypothetical protein
MLCGMLRFKSGKRRTNSTSVPQDTYVSVREFLCELVLDLVVWATDSAPDVDKEPIGERDSYCVWCY